MHVHGNMVYIVLFKCNLYLQAKSVFYEAPLTLEFIFGHQSVAQSRIHHAHNCLSKWINSMSNTGEGWTEVQGYGQDHLASLGRRKGGNSC